MNADQINSHLDDVKKAGMQLLSFTHMDYQLSVVRKKFDEHVLMFKSCCCHGQLAPFPVATYFLCSQSLTS